ncbi:hypothetical protein NPIL_436331 [Nephila pilipes]|uniref:Uncharacterized protein n=1 Tax=Nephila pilipes TaxID=299642 RepID=A0A8X6NIU6_NEPPI|nr:hypothetical protein NPIL_436331 [Nephila pilipes]
MLLILLGKQSSMSETRVLHANEGTPAVDAKKEEPQENTKRLCSYWTAVEQQSTSATPPEVWSICSEAVTSEGLHPLGEPCCVVQWVSHVKGARHLFVLILPFYIRDGWGVVQESVFPQIWKMR